MRESIASALREAGLDPAAVESLARAALAEDLAVGPDVTTLATVAADATSRGWFIAHAPGVLAGGPVAAAVLDCVLCDAGRLDVLVPDATSVAAGTRLLEACGPTRALLTAERTALNLLCHLSGVATVTRRWVDAIAATGATIRDTRKTMPGLRALEKYAVRCGGGVNHRMGLGDAALIKDNHVAVAGGVAAALRAVRHCYPHHPVQVECDTVAQVREALDAGATELLLDNMSLDELRASVRLARSAGDVRLEASGGLSLDRARAVAETGVDCLAVGALTHSAPALDIGFDLDASRPPNSWA